MYLYSLASILIDYFQFNESSTMELWSDFQVAANQWTINLLLKKSQSFLFLSYSQKSVKVAILVVLPESQNTLYNKDDLKICLLSSRL